MSQRRVWGTASRYRPLLALREYRKTPRWIEYLIRSGSWRGKDGRLTEATESFRKSSQILFGSLQLFFFETSPGAWMAEPPEEKP